MTDRELMQQALVALESRGASRELHHHVIAALRERLAQPEQEPVLEVRCFGEKRVFVTLVPVEKFNDGDRLYTAPQPRQWVGLTDEEKNAARWRFLVDNSFDKEGVTQFHVWEHSWEPHSQTGEPTEWKQRVRGPALDRFIDRAIEAAHGIKGEA